jgi:type II secretory pathway component PulC
MATMLVGFALVVLVGLLTGQPAAPEAPAPPAPSLLLVGVIMPDGGEPVAILEDPATHEQEIYPLGAQIGNVRLTKILRDRVVLTSGGSDIEVRLAGSPSPPPGAARRPGPPSRSGRPGVRSGTGR